MKAKTINGVRWIYDVSKNKVTLKGAFPTKPDLVIPKEIGGYSVTDIAIYAFENCKNIDTVEIPATITHVSGTTFAGCTNMTEVYISDLAAWCNIHFAVQESNPCYYSHKLTLNDVDIVNLEIPWDTDSIGQYAFLNCTGIQSISLPRTVKNIGYRAFDDNSVRLVNVCTGDADRITELLENSGFDTSLARFAESIEEDDSQESEYEEEEL